MSRTTNEASLALAEAVEALRPVLREHVADQNGLLPYLFASDVSRWTERHFLTEPAAVRAVFDWFEREYLGGDEEIQSWIALGFVESLPRYDESNAQLRSLLGPALRQVARELGYEPPP